MRRLLVAFATVFVGSGCLCGGCGCPPKHGYPHGDDYRKAELEARQQKLEPVIAALKRYNIDRGKYPDTLDDLIATKYLDELPKLSDTTDHQGESGRIKEVLPIQYLPTQDRSSFQMRISFTFSEFSMSDPRYVATYNSYDGKWSRGLGSGSSAPKATKKD